ncbi:MAG: ABC transporter permease [Coprothermobacterota bacterium]|nr:ABC transporter permease [Coprothermobacterota bacterium]
MKLLFFILRRLALSLVVIVGLSILIFVIARIVPGDPARMALGANAPQEVVDRLRVRMNLDKPIYTQYVLWLGGVLQGDFGDSLYTKRPVVEDIAEFLPATVELVIFAGIIMAAGGILLGTLSAKYNNTWVDTIIRLFSYIGVVTPAFVFAILFMLLFGYLWPILPIMGRLSTGVVEPVRMTGMVVVDGVLQGNFPAAFDGIKHMILPALALALGGLSQEARITRSSMVDNLNKDFVLAHHAYGIPSQRILWRYVMKPSLIPTVSVLGLDFAVLFGNAFLVEMVFNWPGLSRYGINVMLQKDLNAISAVILVLGLIFVLTNIVTDLIVSFLDPRIRLGAAKGE